MAWSNGPQKLCIPNINSVRIGKGFIQYFGPVIWNSIQQKLEMLRICHILRKKFENGNH